MLLHQRTPDLSPHQGQDVHLPRQAVLDGGHDETGAAEDDLPLRPFVQLRLALPHAENAFQHGPLLLVCIGRTFWGGGEEEPPQMGGGGMLVQSLTRPVVNKFR